jgi:hypothetical protein
MTMKHCIKNSNHIVKIVIKAPKYFFSKSKGDLGHADLVQHKINTGSAKDQESTLICLGVFGLGQS